MASNNSLPIAVFPRKISTSAAVDLYDPLVERKFPDASKYNLVVLSGGMADVSYSLPWVLDVLEYVRMVARDFPATKILGICWGHNAVSRALGGQATIEDIHLTEAGKQFFPFAATSGSTFILLAENHECFVNETNNVPTFQAHPKLSNDMAKKMLLGGTTETSTEQLEKEFEKLDKPTDGVKLLERIIQWLKE
ncbi:copper/iron-regulated glutamine amidotransferase [Penicillium argentinense]|uniref:Copper/iron-regulated glutamine amidotransferase n=1 Tax=Penicillium argentinense TaxID=1131581 RepID=A0A9W9EPH2_9EURO|nr:copper/iron-regulated glutamine amidotransferase [Penicillium argentinense]KAJ5085480.1 copper/iron-regulated glutamine amidotransferase [Penicillium argentinense]